MKIYTKTGDQGTTSLFSGLRVKKDATAIEAYGTVDELNAWIGAGVASAEKASIKEIARELIHIQHDLHMLCADLATPMGAKVKVERVQASRAARMEPLIDQFETELAPLRQFVLAGGSELSAQLHIARTICRRAERRVITHAGHEAVNPEIVIYLNRLSDFLFVLARLANKRLNVEDRLWDQSV